MLCRLTEPLAAPRPLPIYCQGVPEHLQLLQAVRVGRGHGIPELPQAGPTTVPGSSSGY